MKHAADSKGGYAHAIFNLTKGDEIHMIVGQQGDKACSHVGRTRLLLVSTVQTDIII